MGDRERKLKVAEEAKRTSTDIVFTWVERAVLILLTRAVQVPQAIAKIRACGRTLDALEDGEAAWSDLSEGQIMTANAADLAAKPDSVLSLTGEMVDFLISDVLEKVGMRGILAQKIGRAIDKLTLAKSGEYRLPEEYSQEEPEDRGDVAHDAKPHAG